MFTVIILLGVLISGVGLWGFILPHSFTAMTGRLAYSAKGLYWIFGFRLLLGSLLLISAPFSLYPTLFYVIGVLSLFGALITVLLGTENVERYVEWWVQRPAICLRVLMLLCWLLGVILVYVSYVSL